MFHSLDLPVPEMPPPDLLLLSLSTAAWIAALTAALGLWRLSSGAHRSKPSACALAHPNPAPTTPVGPTLPAPAPIAACHVEGGMLGSPRSRFIVSFACDECEVDGDGEEAEEDGGEDTWEVAGPRWMGERGDLGWYRYQDRTAIDGSVVRLWGLKGGLTAGKRTRGF